MERVGNEGPAEEQKYIDTVPHRVKPLALTRVVLLLENVLVADSVAYQADGTYCHVEDEAHSREKVPLVFVQVTN